MKSRFRLSAMVWLLTATTGMVIGPTFALMAQAPRRDSTSVIKRNHQQTLGSAVQRELDKLYARDGRRAPKFTTEDALQNIRQSRNLVHQPKTVQPAAAKPSNRLSHKWFARFVPIGKSRSGIKQAGTNQASTKQTRVEQAAVKQVAESKPASNPKKRASKIPQSGQVISQSASSPKSITIVNKSAPSTLAERKTVESNINDETKSTGIKQPRLLQSIAQKSAQLIKRPNSKRNGQTGTSIQEETQRSVRSTAARLSGHVRWSRTSVRELSFHRPAITVALPTTFPESV